MEKVTVTSARLTSKGVKIIYLDGEAVKTLTSQFGVSEEFNDSFYAMKKLFIEHMSFGRMEKFITCTGVDVKIDKDGEALYKIYASMVRPGWDKLELKLNTGWMNQVEKEEFFDREDPLNYPYLLSAAEVKKIGVFFYEAEKYLNGNRFDDQPDLFPEEDKDKSIDARDAE